MVHRWALLALVLCGCQSSGSPIISEARADELSGGGVAVVELFTSEGCSSCPPADAVLADLGRDAPSVYALEFHVDYWDALGWRDPFASADYANRQRQYARSFGTSSLYTPQMIVGGTDGFTGSDRDRARASVARALARGGQMGVSLGVHTPVGDAVSVDVDCAAAPPGSVISVALVQRDATTDVRAGENAGRSLRHTSIVRAFATAPAGPSTLTLRLPPSVPRQALEVVGFVQRDVHGSGGMPILAAARARLRD